MRGYFSYVVIDPQTSDQILSLKEKPGENACKGRAHAFDRNRQGTWESWVGRMGLIDGYFSVLNDFRPLFDFVVNKSCQFVYGTLAS